MTQQVPSRSDNAASIRRRRLARGAGALLLGVAIAGLTPLAVESAAAPAAPAGPSAAETSTARHPGDGPRGRSDVKVQLLAFNDYHGHLEATTPGSVVVPGLPRPVAAGGSEYLSTHLAELREGHRNSLTVAAGDLIGGTPFLSGLFHDEPSVESLDAMGLDVSSVGNHEFDEGVTELLRMQRGGCHPEDGCYFPDEPYPGADFRWLAANVQDRRGRTPLPPYWVKRFQGVKVGFIGMTLEGTDALVAQSGIAGWDFTDEAETANALVPRLRRQGVQAIVVLLHEGGAQSGTYDECAGISGPIVEIVENLHPEIDAVVTGHTHQPYNCSIPDAYDRPRAVTSAFSFGRIISEVNLVLDRRTGDVHRWRTRVTNHVVSQDVARDPALTEIIAKWKSIAEAIGNRVIGRVTADILTRGDRQQESDLVNLVADTHLAATEGNGAQIAFMNPGGVRTDLLYDPPAGSSQAPGQVTYAEAFNIQPFGNLLSTVPMTGSQIETMLRQQCQPAGSSRPVLFMGVSEGFTYSFFREVNDRVCNRSTVRVEDMRLDGVPIDPAATYRVTVNNFLVDGGDNFTVFREIDPSLRVGGGEDLAAFEAYFAANSPVAPPGIDRVTELYPGG